MLSLVWNFFLMKINLISVDGAYENSSVFEIQLKYLMKEEKYPDD